MTRFVWQEGEVEGWPCGKALVSLRPCACCHAVHLLLSCVTCLSTKDPADLRPCTYGLVSYFTASVASAGVAAACCLHNPAFRAMLYGVTFCTGAGPPLSGKQRQALFRREGEIAACRSDSQNHVQYSDLVRSALSSPVFEPTNSHATATEPQQQMAPIFMRPSGARQNSPQTQCHAKMCSGQQTVIAIVSQVHVTNSAVDVASGATREVSGCHRTSQKHSCHDSEYLAVGTSQLHHTVLQKRIAMSGRRSGSLVGQHCDLI